MHHPMEQYHTLVARAIQQAPRPDRTGTGVRSIFGAMVAFDHRQPHNFPIITTKQLNTRAVIAELIWFLSGSTNTSELNARIWDEWADEFGDLGPVYGKQWRHWEHGDGLETDQIAEVIENLKSDPYSRRHVVSAWNVADLPKMALAPCHYSFQFYVESDGTLSIKVDQRSADLMLGVPFNLCSYSLLLFMVAQCVGRRPGRHIHCFGDMHVYENHIEGAREMLSRSHFKSPEVGLNPAITCIDDFKESDVVIGYYESHPPIPLPVAI